VHRVEAADLDAGRAEQPIADAIPGLPLIDDDPVERRVGDRRDADRLVETRVEALADGVEALDAVAREHLLELSAHETHPLDRRGLAGRRDRAVDVVEDRQQLLDQARARLLGDPGGVALDAAARALVLGDRGPEGLLRVRLEVALAVHRAIRKAASSRRNPGIRRMRGRAAE
jgi:hypothetical protein